MGAFSSTEKQSRPRVRPGWKVYEKGEAFATVLSGREDDAVLLHQVAAAASAARVAALRNGMNLRRAFSVMAAGAVSGDPA
jgi:hypothetical protein